MDLWDLLKVLARRWYVCVPLIISTSLAAVLLGSRVPADYEAQSSVILLGPSERADEVVTRQPNPYLSVGLGTTAQSVQVAVSSNPARAKVARAGLPSDYELEVDTQSSILVVTATASSAREAIATTTKVIALARQDLRRRQAAVDVPKWARIQTRAVSVADSALPVTSTAKRTSLALFAAGMMLAVALTLLYDTFLNLRSARRLRSHTRHVPVEASPGPGDSPTFDRGDRSAMGDGRGDELTGADGLTAGEGAAPWPGPDGDSPDRDPADDHTRSVVPR